MNFQLINPKYELPPPTPQLSIFEEKEQSEYLFCIAEISENHEQKIVAYYNFITQSWYSDTKFKTIKYWLKQCKN